MSKSKARKKNRVTSKTTQRKSKPAPEEGKNLLKIVIGVTLVMMILMYLIFKSNNG